nr:MAG TPA: hypothetical protein [Caudoviricetes sp.]
MYCKPPGQTGGLFYTAKPPRLERPAERRFK